LRIFTLIISLCLLTISCKPETTDGQVIIEDKQDYARKLADLYFIEAWVSRATKKDKDSIKTMLADDFEKLHKISVENFHTQLDELKTDPIVFAEIMDSVGVILKNKGEVKKKIDDKKKDDSKK